VYCAFFFSLASVNVFLIFGTYMLYVENRRVFDLNISVMQYLMHHNMRSLVKMLLRKLSWGA
jgi:hypothetical protein